jgi:hypothetical protein
MPSRLSCLLAAIAVLLGISAVRSDESTTLPSATRPAKVRIVLAGDSTVTDKSGWGFVACQMGDHVKPEGWNNWGRASNEQTARYAEYKYTGPGADRSRRVAWSRELSSAEAAMFTIPNVLAGSDHWDPEESNADSVP